MLCQTREVRTNAIEERLHRSVLDGPNRVKREKNLRETVACQCWIAAASCMSEGSECAIIKFRDFSRRLLDRLSAVLSG